MLEGIVEVKKAKQATERLLGEFRNNPQVFDNTLDSQTAIKRYYDLYYHEFDNNETKYPAILENTHVQTNFVDLLGYDSHKIETLERQGDYLESRIHPDDRTQLAALQVTLGQFIYSLPFEQRNNYSNIYSFRILNANQQYIRATSRHQVLEQDRNGKAWLIIGNMDISPDQKKSEMVDCTVLNLKNGELFSPSLSFQPSTNLTNREIEVLCLIQKGLLSKEIADRLCISIHTVNIHRQNLLRKLGVQNSIEAIRLGQEIGLLG